MPSTPISPTDLSSTAKQIKSLQVRYTNGECMEERDLYNTLFYEQGDKFVTKQDNVISFHMKENITFLEIVEIR